MPSGAVRGCIHAAHENLWQYTTLSEHGHLSLTGLAGRASDLSLLILPCREAQGRAMGMASLESATEKLPSPCC